MSEARLSDVDEALKAMQRMAPSATASVTNSRRGGRAAPRRRRTLRSRFWRFALWSLVLVVGALLPFIALVRGAVYLFMSHQMAGWAAVALAAAASGVVLLVYVLGIAWRLGGRRRVARVVVRVVPLLVLVYCGYALAYISAENVKAPALQQTYTALHPLLRLSVSTLVLADRTLVVTDTARRRADYARMGLPALEHSLHFEQADGYAYAVDLRTRNRAAWKNQLMTAYFNVMGFRTLRHVGTADHLHVALTPPGR